MLFRRTKTDGHAPLNVSSLEHDFNMRRAVSVYGTWLKKRSYKTPQVKIGKIAVPKPITRSNLCKFLRFLESLDPIIFKEWISKSGFVIKSRL
jgi:hypothetical protein